MSGQTGVLGLSGSVPEGRDLMANGDFKKIAVEWTLKFAWAAVAGWISLTFWGYTTLKAEIENQKVNEAQINKEIVAKVEVADTTAKNEVKESIGKLEHKLDSIDAAVDDLKVKAVTNSEKISMIQSQQIEIILTLKDISKEVKKR